MTPDHRREFCGPSKTICPDMSPARSHKAGLAPISFGTLLEYHLQEALSGTFLSLYFLEGWCPHAIVPYDVQRAACKYWVSPSILWVLGIELRSSESTEQVSLALNFIFLCIAA